MAITALVEEPAPTATYSWAYGHTGGVQAEQAAAEVQAIYAANGNVTPQAVVEAATPAASPLHAAFEWDDTTAARLHREQEARTLLAKLIVSYRREDGSVTPPTRYLVKLTARPDEDVEDETLQAATEPHVYIPVKRVMDDEVLKRKYVREAFLSAVSWSRHYRDVEAFARIHEAIEDLGADFGKPA